MTDIKVTVTGEKETTYKLNMFNMEKKAEAMKVVRKAALGVGREARKNVPVSSRKKSTGSPGDLKKSIRTKFYYDNLGAMIIPYKPKGSHRAIIEHGTKMRRNKKGQNRGSITPKPFMVPAKKSQESSFNAGMIKIFEKGKTTI